MSPRRSVSRIGPALYALAGFVAILAPSLAVNVAARHGALGGMTDGWGLTAASAVIGAGFAFVSYHRLLDEERMADVQADIWIASVNALVVLALATPLLTVVVLVAFADEHARLADHHLPVVLLWVGLQLVSVVLSELTGRFVFWWLEPRRAPHPGWSHRRRRHERPTASVSGRSPAPGPPSSQPGGPSPDRS